MNKNRRRIAAALGAPTPIGVQLRQVIIVSLDATTPATCTVKLYATGPSIAGVRYNADASIAATDTVMAVVQGQDMWVLCKLAP
jgi:hypothetical protein